jgi:3-phenylpropionate/trans-cinnamate dioxygenase ferredoxin subunit
MSGDGWTTVLSAADLPESTLTKVDAGGVAVLLFRTGEHIFGIGARCTHAGMPLDRAPVTEQGTEPFVTCPAHGSRFLLANGRVLRPPAQAPLPSFEVREDDGEVQVRPAES